MAVIQPFKGIRPAKDKAHLVASRAVDHYNSSQINARLAENPYTFLHIIKPEFGQDTKTKPYTHERHQKIKNKFQEFIRNGIMISDKEECLYVYRQIKDRHSFTAIIACASVEDYFKQVIKKHEQTLAEREEKLKSYMEICDFNAEPICLCYPDSPAISRLVAAITKQEPVYDFSTTDTIEHILWKVNDKKNINKVRAAFKNIPSLYIADGHHRCAASSLLGKIHKQNNPNHTGKESYNYFMAAFAPMSDLKIFEYNRAVKDMNGLSTEAIFKKLAASFDITDNGSIAFKPERKGIFGMYLNEKWYRLKERSQSNKKSDAESFNDKVLAAIFDIHDLRRDKRVLFISGTKGIEELKKTVDSGKAKVGFSLFPVAFEEIQAISDSGKTLPPKTTWVEPKLRSGLLMYSLSNITK